MADSRKRRELWGSSGMAPQRRRLRRSDRGARGRTTTTAVMGAVMALLLMVGVATAGAQATNELYVPRQRAPVYNPRRLVWEEHVKDLEQRGPNCFKRYYRMTKTSFGRLADRLRDRIEANQHFGKLRSANGAIPVEIHLAIALRMLTGAHYMDVGILFGVSFPTVYFILWDVVDAINSSETIGSFRFPQTEGECEREAAKWQALSTNGVFSNVVAAADGLLIKTIAPTAADTANVMQYFSGSKSGYGINVQATCNADYRFCQVSAISPGATNDWAAWNRSSLSEAVNRLPGKYQILGDAAYPLSNKLLTPYPGKMLRPGEDSFNFHLSQLRVRIEQSFGILVSTWGILWKPLKVQFSGRTSLIMALFRLHNFLQDAKDVLIDASEEDAESGRGRPVLTADRSLPATWGVTPGDTPPLPSRSGESSARAEIRFLLQQDKQWRPSWNVERNS